MLWASHLTFGVSIFPSCILVELIYSTIQSSYFEFHPTPETDAVTPKTHGVTPVWGFGTVIISTHLEVHHGDRVYGYFAPARYAMLAVSARDFSKYAFYVPRPHLPAGALLLL